MKQRRRIYYTDSQKVGADERFRAACADVVVLPRGAVFNMRRSSMPACSPAPC